MSTPNQNLIAPTPRRPRRASPGTARSRSAIKVWTAQEWTASRKARLASNLAVSAALRAYRTRHGITLAMVAYVMGCSASTVWSKEAGITAFTTQQVRAFRRAVMKGQ